MLSQNKLKIAWIASFIVLLIASLSKGVDSSSAFGIDIFFHISIYAILAAVPLILIKKRFTAFMITMAIAPLGFFFEFIHGSVSGYGFKMLDAFFNNLGIVLGIAMALIIRIKQHYERELK